MLLNADSERYERFVISVLTATSTRTYMNFLAQFKDSKTPKNLLVRLLWQQTEVLKGFNHLSGKTN